MARVDLTDTKKTKPADFEQQTPFFGKAINVDLVADGITEEAVDHLLLEIGEQEALVGVFIVCLETLAGWTTLQLKAGDGGDAITGAIPIANLQAGDSGFYGTFGITATTTFAGYANGTAYDLAIRGAGAAATAGKFILIPMLVNMKPFV